MSGVETVHWNPLRPVFQGPIGSRLPIQRRVNNFGDLLGPLIVERMLAERSVDGSSATRHVRLLTVGSVLHLARDNDTVWGSGVNGKELNRFTARHLDVRAVRGPLTKNYLESRGISTPDVFGDPGLLVGELWPRESLFSGRPHGTTIVMNLNDRVTGRDSRYLNPRRPVSHCLSKIAESAFVTGTSLHAIVVAESFGIPARLLRSGTEPDFKYRDYYLGTGRTDFTPARTVEEALALGGETPPTCDTAALRHAFPVDLWTSQRHH